MDKVAKALKKLSAKERQWVKAVLSRLVKSELSGLDIQKLTGHKDIFRVRKSEIRIIYRQVEGDIFVLAIERRSEKTYRNF